MFGRQSSRCGDWEGQAVVSGAHTEFHRAHGFGWLLEEPGLTVQ